MYSRSSMVCERRIVMKYDFSLEIDTHNSVSLILKQIKPGTKVLEFGPAMGRMTKYLQEELECEVSIVEIDEEGYESSMQFAVNGFLGNAETMEWVDKFKGCEFDYITFADVLEHLRNPEDVLMKARSLLNNDGRIIISVPNIANNAVIIDLINNRFDYREVGLLDHTHIHFFTYYTLKEMISKCDLVIFNERATYAQPYETEFGNDYTVISREMENILKNKDFGAVYQFVFTCMRKEDYLENQENIVVQKKIQKTFPMDTFKIYVNDGISLNEENVIFKKIVSGQNNLEIDMEQYDIHDLIRLDFTEDSCLIKIDSLQIDGLDYEVPLLSGNFSQRLNNYFLFLDKDPYLFVNGLAGKHNRLSIKFNISKIFFNDLEKEYINKMQSLVNDVDDILNEKEKNKNELIATNEKLVEDENEITGLKNTLIELNEIVANNSRDLERLNIEKNDLINRYENEITQYENNKNQYEIELKYRDEIIQQLTNEIKELNSSILRRLKRKILNK